MDLLDHYLLEAHARGRRVVLIVDEAQNLSFETLEQVRLLTNLETATTKLLQIILIGQQELRALLEQPDLRQLAQRITGRYHLSPLSTDETAGYVKHRMRVAGATAEAFTPGALREVHRLSKRHAARDQRHLRPRAARRLHPRGTSRRARLHPRRRRRGVRPAGARAVAEMGDRRRHRRGACPGGVRRMVAARPQRRRRPRCRRPRRRQRAGRARCPQPPASSRRPPRSPPPLALDRLLAQNANDTTTEAALQHLFARWDIQYAPNRGRGCEQASAQGLECLFQKGSWAQLRTLDRPAILTLTDDVGGTHQVLLVGLTDEAATIELGGATQDLPIATISRYWFGDFLLLWRPPLAVVKALAPACAAPRCAGCGKTCAPCKACPRHGRPAISTTTT